MKQIIMCICLLLSASLALNAQDEKKSKINSIKKSDKYIYAEATLPTLEAAYALAEEMLHNNINEWVEQNKKRNGAQNIILRNTSEEWIKLDLPRGNMYRAFVYIAKTDIIPADNVVVLETTTETSENTEQVTYTATSDVGIPSDVLAEVLGVYLFEDIEPCLVKLKKEEKITDYNKYASVKDPENYCMVVYNREGQVEALLGTGKEDRTNLRTNQKDSLSNYKGCGAICFKVKE